MEVTMSQLAKLNIKTATRAAKLPASEQRKRKLLAALDEQVLVAEAAISGKTYEVTRKVWAKNEAGESVLIDRVRKLRPWFFEQDGGWYVQCRYGNKVLALGDGNAVQVKALKDVTGVLAAFKAAASAGELDEAIQAAVTRKPSK